MDPMKKARRGLAVYFAVVLLLTVPLELAMIFGGGTISDHPLLVVALMWSPAVASIVARLVNRDGIRDVSFRFGGLRGLAWNGVAWVYPIVVGLLAYGTAWATGLVGRSSSWLELGWSIAANATFWTAMSMITAFGEELGWRGYMLTRLVDARVPAPVLISGLVWGVWHLPIILSGQYAQGGSPLVSAGLFMLCIVPFSFFAARLRFETGSVWPPALAHAAWNAIIQGAFDPACEGQSIWIGESGILVVAANLLCVLLVTRGTWRRLHAPE
jgi:membrane protease YdiL (CAAX protease family)